MSLIASCKLHGIEPRAYLEAVIRLVPVWPRDRYIELAPMNWLRTRSRLVQSELDAPFGHMTVPAKE
jgi:transposase